MSYWLGLRDFWGRWVVDNAGVPGDEFSLEELEQRVRDGTLPTRTWLRHRYTRRFALAGEVLYHHGRASEEEFNQWIPKPLA